MFARGLRRAIGGKVQPDCTLRANRRALPYPPDRVEAYSPNFGYIGFCEVHHAREGSVAGAAGRPTRRLAGL